jgi:hypothetical protein
MTYIWHLYVANTDVFTWSTTSYIKYELYRINAPSNTCDWSIKYRKDIESVIKLSNLFLKHMHGKKWEQIGKKRSAQGSFQ